MKRCPQCLFLYPDSDVRCDFDQTSLEVVDDAEVDRATHQSKPRRKALPLVAAVGVILSVMVFAFYLTITRQTRKAAAAETSVNTQPQTLPSPAEVTAPSPSPTAASSPSPSAKPSPPGISTAHTRASSDPVSTSGPGMGTRQGGKPVIVLTSGGKIEADEAWRTKDGVWYRRNGMVTLLKRAQVKAIVTR